MSFHKTVWAVMYWPMTSSATFLCLMSFALRPLTDSLLPLGATFPNGRSGRKQVIRTTSPRVK